MAITALMLIVAGCHRHERYSRQNEGGNGSGTEQTPGGQTSKPTLKQNTAWGIEYGERQIIDGKTVEQIVIKNVPENVLYLVSVINLENYSTYKGDVLAFMEYELDNAGEYIYHGTPEPIKFDRFSHGTWYAFIIGIDSENKLTGEYNYIKFVVEEEVPTEAFSKWLGTWKVKGKTDGRPAREVTYALTISSEEANYVYRVDGWETLEKEESGWVQMNMDNEFLFTFFDEGKMYFTSQYIQTYHDNDYDDEVEEVFLGEIFYDDIYDESGIYIIESEDIDLAFASMAEDGKTAEIDPVDVITEIGGHEFTAPFYDMKYFGWSQNERSWFVFNQNVAVFPLTMEKVSDVASVSTKAGVFTRGSMSKGRSKALRGKIYVPRDKSKPVKAVRAR